MAYKINDLTALGRNLDPTDLLEVSLTGGTGSRKITGAQIIASAGGGGASGIHTQLLGGGSIFGGVETSNMVSSANLSTYVCQANQMIYFPYIPNNTFTSTTLSFYVSSVAIGGLCKLYIYSSDGVNVPKNKLYESTEIDLSTSGSKTITTSYTFTKGTVYWFGIYSNIFGPNIYGLGTNGGAVPVAWLGTTLALSWVEVGITYPTAPTVASPNSFQTVAPLIRLK